MEVVVKDKITIKHWIITCAIKMVYSFQLSKDNREVQYVSERKDPPKKHKHIHKIVFTNIHEITNYH